MKRFRIETSKSLVLVIENITSVGAEVFNGTLTCANKVGYAAIVKATNEFTDNFGDAIVVSPDYSMELVGQDLHIYYVDEESTAVSIYEVGA